MTKKNMMLDGKKKRKRVKTREMGKKGVVRPRIRIKVPQRGEVVRQTDESYDMV